MPTADFLHEAVARGFVHQCTDAEGLEAALKAGVVSGYIGYDLTADSLHVGHMVQIMLLRLLQRHGHRPVALMGGGTSKIGDPSFREEARQLMTEETILSNMAGIRRNIEPFLRFGASSTEAGVTDAIMPNNADWLDKLGYIELLREIGPHFSISRMLAFDSVKNRLEREQGLTFLEFNYSILQSYDFRELNRRHGVSLQMGGSDQWGNIVSGIDLVRRTDGRQVFGLTTPLITTASGAKMGKSASGAVWLTADRLPVFDYFQFWRNTEDADVGRFLKLFTDNTLDEIDALGCGDINMAKERLAFDATSLAHGEAAASAALEQARRIFMRSDTAMAGAAFTLESAVNLPKVEIGAGELTDGGIQAFRLFALAGLAASNAEARRLVRGGGARLNDAAVKDEGLVVPEADLRAGIKLSAGRKHHRLLQIV